MDSFAFHLKTPPTIFGSGKLQELPVEVSKLGCVRPLILSTPKQSQQADRVALILNGKLAGTFTKACMHTPENVTKEALNQLSTSQADCLISIGGGSTIGLGKALSFRTNLPHVAIPTTYAGSEVTPILGETVNGVKKTISDPRILPTLVIYDVDLTLTLPLSFTATSAINSIAHAAEALYAQNSNPIIRALAAQGVAALANSLPELMNDPTSRDARSTALYGAWLCGICLGNTSMSLHHKLCHTLGGKLNLPHAETHAVILPHALSYNAPKATEALKALATALPKSDGDAIEGLNLLLDAAKIGRSLEALGMKESDIDTIADMALQTPYWNPREIDRTAIRELIRRAWAGEKARADL